MVGDKTVPSSPTSAPALGLAPDRSNIWSFSTRGFFNAAGTSREPLVIARPYQPGLVP